MSTEIVQTTTATEQTMNIGEFMIANKTCPWHYNIAGKNGKTEKSKKKEWLIIEGVPCQIISVKDDVIIMNSFTSSKDRLFEVEKNILNDLFTKASINDGYISSSKYPTPIPIIEFENREKVKQMVKKLEEMIKHPECNTTVRKIFEDKLFQMLQSQGAPYITIDKYDQYKKGEITLSAHQRFGSEIFNRNTRWCPPIDITYDEFKVSPSYPAPLGVRPKDFCLPSELLETLKELVTQIYNMPNIDKKSFETIREEFNLQERKHHCCLYCGTCVDANDYSSVYKSETNFMEICHRDPNDRFLTRNMYWGHGDCNRRQGGYSEDERIKDVLQMLRTNSTHLGNYTSQLKNLISTCETTTL
jgi:hypothetical protein